jgi:diguanylate cyclase (GGDEF)-like protein
MRTRRTIVVNDMAVESMVAERVRTTFGAAAGLFVPLLHRGGVVGLVTFNDPVPRAWTAHDVRLAEVIAESIAPSVASFLALESVRQEREALADRTKVLEGMNRLVEALAVAPDEATTGQVAARAVAQVFRLTAATALFVDPSVALLEPVGTAGAARAHPVVNGPMNCPAIRGGRIFRVASPTEPVICPYMPWSDGPLGYVCVPLLAGGEPVGALFMEPAEDSALEETFVRAAADRVALSLTNRRVLETAQRQATTDGLTGLHNRYFLQEQLRLLHSLAARHGQPYAAVAFDVDGLKQVNDTFGHEMGDLALRGFANTIKRTIRASDVGVRTGGDEFLVLIPHGGLEDARIVAERVRDALLQQARSEPHTAVTVSAGVSAWRTGRTAEQVLEAADAQLYAAKRAGRDRIAVEPESQRTSSPQSG